MTNPIKIAQTAKMIQKELGTLFLTETARWFGNAFISVTAVDLSSDVSLAKVYLSFTLHDNQEILLQQINGHKNTIKRLLGKRVAGKMHKVPNLKFIVDRSVVQGARVTTLIDQLDL
ncbi:30S ribosome-binding factor RbfA [Cardinium endosymbiont of Dermatophagoides farinae]|uniref:30S ribosome-binding factor RbfA n=1 Tax=Cardinium endosymbiont of Dermatophagoides farinae TaxID=2597823 RepID=UPI001642A980|nr:30S ribosome-binding factor RbfA [Cardinium endosymbiont of Dermatophagoides farinae]